ncbi:hypothetical protein V8E54_007158 [Elaphomyces granulatus]
MLLYVLSTLLFTYILMLLPWRNLRAIIINPQNNLQMRGERVHRQTACTRESTCVGRPAQRRQEQGQQRRPVGRPAREACRATCPTRQNKVYSSFPQ